MVRCQSECYLHMNELAVEVTLEVTKVLDHLRVPYLVCGSLASSVHGTVRSTLDADILADIKLEHVEPLVDCLNSDFYISPEAIYDAITHRTSFNVIHFASAFKVDIFLPKPRRFDEQQFCNRVSHLVATDPVSSAYIASSEDTILAKLEWYKQGNEISERQWLDIVGIVKVQGKRLNVDYLRHGAIDLDVVDLLEESLKEIPQ
jgi:hypothetical protein